MSGIGISDIVSGGISVVTDYRASRSNFKKKNSIEDTQNSFSRIIASRENLWKAKNIDSIQKGMVSTLEDLTAAKSSFDIVKSNVAEIQSLVDSAYNGLLTEAELDEAQNTINDLVEEIDFIAGNTELNGKSLFDGDFQQDFNTGLPDSDNYSLNFSRAGEIDEIDPVGELTAPGLRACLET